MLGLAINLADESLLAAGLFKMIGPPPRPDCMPPTCKKCGDCMGKWCNSKRWLCTIEAWGDIILSLIIFGIYGSILFGMVPSDPKISWEARDHAPPTPTSTPFDPLP